MTVAERLSSRGDVLIVRAPFRIEGDSPMRYSATQAEHVREGDLPCEGRTEAASMVVKISCLPSWARAVGEKP